MITNLRRDSGFSPSEGVECEGVGRLDIVLRGSLDSGVGSPSSRPAWRRTWGRRCQRRTELRKLELIKEALHELSEMHGGEIKFSYTSRSHPNLKLLNLSKTVLALPQKEVEGQLASEDWTYYPGYFLSRTGLTDKDVLDNRLPNMPEGGLAVVSNGLAIDLYRIFAKSYDPDARAKVAQFIFNFLELKFPDELLDKAVDHTVAHIRKNVKYVEACEISESTAFLFSPFSVPAEVCEMALTMEDSEESVHLGLAALYPGEGEVSESQNLVTQNGILCSLDVTGDRVTASQTDSQYNFQLSTSASDLDSSAEADNAGASVPEHVGKDNRQDLHNLDVPWASISQGNYKLISTENEMYTVTAAVYDNDQQMYNPASGDHSQVTCDEDTDKEEDESTCHQIAETATEDDLDSATETADLNSASRKSPQSLFSPKSARMREGRIEENEKTADEQKHVEERDAGDPSRDLQAKITSPNCHLEKGRRSSRTRNVQLPSRFRDFETSSSAPKVAKLLTP